MFEKQSLIQLRSTMAGSKKKQKNNSALLSECWRHTEFKQIWYSVVLIFDIHCKWFAPDSVFILLQCGRRQGCVGLLRQILWQDPNHFSSRNGFASCHGRFVPLRYHQQFGALHQRWLQVGQRDRKAVSGKVWACRWTGEVWCQGWRCGCSQGQWQVTTLVLQIHGGSEETGPLNKRFC